MQHQEESGLLGTIVLIIIILLIRYAAKHKPSPPPETKNHYTEEASVSYEEAPSAPEAVEQYAAAAPPAAVIKGVFVVVTSHEPQTQMVAMSLSTQISLKGKYLRILLCGPGGDLALKAAKETILKPLNKSPNMLLKDLIAKKIVVEVCPFYLANRGGTPADLIDGVTVAQPPLVAEALLEPGVKLFTF